MTVSKNGSPSTGAAEPSSDPRQALAPGLAHLLAGEQRPVEAEGAVVEELDPVPEGQEGALGHALGVAQPKDVLVNLLLGEPVGACAGMALQGDDDTEVALLRAPSQSGQFHVTDHALAQR